MPQPLEKLPVIDQAGVRLFWVNEDQARHLIKMEQVTLIRTNRKIRALRIKPNLGQFMKSAPGHIPGGTKYSHNHETEHNPQGVWTLIRIPASQRPRLAA